MTEINVRSVRMKQPLRCGCGHMFSPSDISETSDSVRMVCPSCHADALEIEISLPEPEDGLWD